MRNNDEQIIVSASYALTDTAELGNKSLKT
ncbi:hypothetical protein SAMN05216409_11461 [Pseudomonas lutea]|uniref:Uncharacterized protein n=1 Tax=Pseudomonas lutea TaxID=243924 RepID=A0A9X8MG80_9PSED|nr:hypothetical protein SAMN05216409_11461 [Pseudomonas lutea]